MAKPIVHAESSAKKFGGDSFQYLHVHQFLDGTKSAHATVKHRAVLHSVEGCALTSIVLGDRCGPDNQISTLDVALRHVEEDLGRVPTLLDYLNELTLEPWMFRGVKSVESHARADAVRYGGLADEYLFVHQFVDSVVPRGLHPKPCRLVLHHAYGAFVAERALGLSFVNSAYRTVHVRDLVEQHVLRELGRIPDLGDWLRPMKTAPWMSGTRRPVPCND